jgi:ribulose-phosphate 3-epimerase
LVAAGGTAFLEYPWLLCYPSGGYRKRKSDLKHRIVIAPSILAADFARLSAEIQAVENAGATMLHIDVMDGHFVPNITIGPPVIESLRKVTSLPLDAHLMIENPGRWVDDFISAGVNWLSVHVEADYHINRTLAHVRERGVRAGVAFNPATPIGFLEEVLPDVDHVLLMTVNPGFGGQKFVPSTLKKIRKLSEYIASNGFRARIEVDGGIGPENLAEVLAAGAEIIVAGSAIFRSVKGTAAAFSEMNAIAGRHLRASQIA